MGDKSSRGFTLFELFVVIIILGILGIFGLPRYARFRDKQHDQDAITNLKLIMAAEKVYRLEAGFYFAPTTDIKAINTNLSLSLPTATNVIWNYQTTTTYNDPLDPQNHNCCVQATRTAAKGGDGRIWSLWQNEDGPQNNRRCQ